VFFESILFVGAGSVALRSVLVNSSGASEWLWLGCVAGLLIAWHALHAITRWGGRVRLVPRALTRAFRPDRLLVTLLTLAPLAVATAAGVGFVWLSVIGWTAIVLAHLQCQVRWVLKNKDLWAIAWEDTERRTAFGPRHSGKQRKYWEDFFKSLRDERPDARIVDIGSGNLDVSQVAHAAAPDFELHATDSSQVDVASFPWAVDLQFHRWTFEETEFPNEYLDGLTSSNAIEYSKTIDVALAETFRVLAPGARAAFLMHHPDSHVVEHFRRSARDIEKLREIGIDPVIEKYLRTRDEGDRAAVREKLSAMRSAGSRELASQAKLIDEFHQDPSAIELWIEFKDTIERNYVLATDLCKMAGAHLADADTLRAHFENAGFAIDRLERFDSEHGVVNWAVIARVPFSGEPFGLGDSFAGLENGLTRALPRSVAQELVRTLLRARKKSIREEGGTATFKIERVVPALLEITGEEAVAQIRVRERERNKNAVVYSVVDDATNSAGLQSILDVRAERDAWIGME